MSASLFRSSFRLPRAVGLLLAGLVAVVAISWAAVAPSTAADPSAAPLAAPSPTPTLTAAQRMCESAADLRLYIGFLRATSLSEDGVLPVLVGLAASVGEARRLVGLVDATYRPMVEDLVASLEELRASVRELRDQGTLGAGIASVGEAITAIGEAMDALSTALRAPCPIELPDGSAPPAASPASSASPAPSA